MQKAFTLIELLVVIAIIAILAAILFPVFAQAKVAAKKATSVSDAKQWGLSIAIYENDADDMFPVWTYNGTFDVDKGDRSLYNVIGPYVKSHDMTKTANSPFSILQREEDASFPDPLKKVGASVQLQQDYNLGWLTDYGINYQVMTGFSVKAGVWMENPQSTSYIAKPAETLQVLTGIFGRNASGGLTDGGQLPIDPPCYQYPDGSTFIPSVPGGNGIYFFGGWTPSNPLAWNVFGGAWPYYNNYVTVGFMDTHVKPEQPSQLAVGCDVQDFWGGFITDQSTYQWDNR